MKKTVTAFLLLLIVSSILAQNIGEFVCPPCGCPEDNKYFKEKGHCPACNMLLIPFKKQIVKDATFAQLGSGQDIIVGETTTIKSQFKGLPVVEPNISAHPDDNNFLLAAAMIVTDITRPYQSCRLSSFVSRDGGKTWEETAHNFWGYDPWTAILQTGETVMSWIGTEGRFKDQYPIQFFTSQSGGLRWQDEVQTLAGNHDGTKITALNNTFYFTTVRFGQNMGADVILYEKKSGSEFQEVAKIDGHGQRLNFCEPAILTDGTVTFPAVNSQQEIWVQNYNSHTQILSEKYIISENPVSMRGYMRMVADVSKTSNFTDRIYLVRAVEHKGIWLNYSGDKGKTWTDDIRVDLFENTTESKANVPSVAVNQNGVLGISWVDSQHDPLQQKNDIYFTVSNDGGKSFQRPVRVTDVSSTPRTTANGEAANRFPGGGHYLGIAAKRDASFQLIWSDSRSGLFELQTCNVKPE